MKPTERIAQSASTPRAGLFATLRGLLRAGGSGAPSHRLIAIPLITLCALCALLGLSAGIARAQAPGLVSNGQFESANALGVAVDNSGGSSHGDVYVAGFFFFDLAKREAFPGRVNKFDASGNLLSPPSPAGEAIAYSGTAVNQTNGDVYALDAINNQVDTYDPGSGVLVGSFSVPSSSNTSNFFGFFTVVGIGTDSAGNVYVPVVPQNEVLEYSPSGGLLKTFTGGSGAGALRGPTGVAVDPVGNVWVADPGNERIEELSPADVPVGQIRSEGVQAIAVDANGHVFATVFNGADSCGRFSAPCAHLVEYSSTGVQLADLGAGLFGEGSQSGGSGVPLPSMVAVNDSTGRIDVTDYYHRRVFVFDPPVAPKLENELAVEVGTAEAKLGGLVNPGGIATSYRAEYDTREYKEGEGPHGVSVPFPEGDAGTGFQSRTVWATALGLAPGTTYHYRFVVTSELGTVVGEDRTFTTESVAQAACPNERLRTGFSAGLPDCRAYELVTPPNKISAQPDPDQDASPIEYDNLNDLAAVDGNRLVFRARDVLPGSNTAGESYVAARGSSGWSSENVTPPENYNCFSEVAHLIINGSYSADLSRAILFRVGGSGGCSGPESEPVLVSGEPQGTLTQPVLNLFVRDNTTGSYQLVDVTPPGVVPAKPEIVLKSADLSHVVFRENAKLTPDAPEGVVNVYEWSEGVVRLLRTVLPDGTPVAGSVVAFSPDGSRLFFTAAGKLYARVNDERTVQVDEPQQGASGPGGGGSFVAVSADGSRVFFTDDASAGLTSDTVAGSGSNLYRYDLNTGHLSDLTPASHAEVQGVNVSEDGSNVYFTAKGSLAAGAVQGESNPYFWHEGTTTFVSTLAKVSLERVRFPGNIAFLAFESLQRLTGYDNTDVNSGEPDPEIYLVDLATSRLFCASCNPSGQRPTEGHGFEVRVPRNVSDNGQVFFDSTEALLPADTNGQMDVYEFEPAGVGSCVDAAGCVFLISTGTSSRITSFIEASANGSDVFLREYQKLVPQDKQEEARTIYDARVSGGFPEPVASPACVTADACRAAPTPSPSIFGAPASQTFSGAGNLAQPLTAMVKTKTVKCKRGFVRKHNKCVKQKKAKRASNHRRPGR